MSLSIYYLSWWPEVEKSIIHLFRGPYKNPNFLIHIFSHLWYIGVIIHGSNSLIDDFGNLSETLRIYEHFPIFSKTNNTRKLFFFLTYVYTQGDFYICLRTYVDIKVDLHKSLCTYVYIKGVFPFRKTSEGKNSQFSITTWYSIKCYIQHVLLSLTNTISFSILW